MQYKRLGSSEVKVSEIILGTWAMGGSYWGKADDLASIRAIHAAIDSGMNTLDTAEAYNDGYSERVIGQAIKGRDKDVVICTKAANYHSSSKDLKESCERSLRNLGRDYIDVYFLHWPSNEFGHPFVPFEETLNALAELKKEGKIRSAGLSNFKKADFETARKILDIDAYQPPFNILWREVDDMFPYCIQNEIAVLPYASVAQGLLTGALTIHQQFNPDDKRTGTPLFQPENMRRALKLVEKLRPLAQKYGKTIVQFVLRWTMQVSGVTAPLVGGRTDLEISDGLGAIGWKMSEDDFLAVDALSKEFYNALPPYKNFFSTALKTT